MADHVSADRIAGIVGATRHLTEHIARAVSAEQRVYILHSHECLYEYLDLRQCPFSLALDRGIDPNAWPMDLPLVVAVDENDRIVPFTTTDARERAAGSDR